MVIYLSQNGLTLCNLHMYNLSLEPPNPRREHRSNLKHFKINQEDHIENLYKCTDTHHNRNCPSTDACNDRAEHISVLNQFSLRHLWPYPGGIPSELVTLKVQVEVESHVPWWARRVGCSGQFNRRGRTSMLWTIMHAYTEQLFWISNRCIDILYYQKLCCTCEH